MQNRETRLVEDLHQTISDLLVDLSDIFTETTERGDMELIKFFYNQMHKVRIMHHTIDKLVPWKQYIDSRDINFFDENRYLFEGLPEDRVVYYSELITGGHRLTQDDMDVCWNYLDTMIACAEEYQVEVSQLREHGL